MNLTISLRKFLESISSASGLDYSTCENLLGELTAYITTMLSRGESVCIKGIGTFRMIDDEVVYAPDQELAEKINLPFEAFEAVELPDEVTDAMLDSLGKPDSIVTDKTEIDITEETESEVETSDEANQTPTPPPFFPPLPEVAIEAISQQPQSTTEPLPVNTKDLPDVPSIPESTNTTHDSICDETIPETETNRHQWRLIIAAFIAGMVCFIAGYAIGRWHGASKVAQSDTTALDTNTEEVIELAHDSVAASDTIETSVVAEPITSIDTPIPSTTSTIVTDTIKSNRFLTTMARRHYGQMEFWVYIYEENASKIVNPNQLGPGTVVVIPPASKYGIDASNPESVARAKAKAKEIESRF